MGKKKTDVLMREAAGTMGDLVAEVRELRRLTSEAESESIRIAMMTRFLADPGADWDSHVWNFACSPEVKGVASDVAIQGLSRALADVLCWARDNDVLGSVLGYYADAEYSERLVKREQGSR